MRINLDNSIIHALTTIFDVIVATLLFLVCCLPVFTVGASAAAMYATMIAIADDRCTGVVGCFFGAFRDNFKQATLLWLLDAAVGLVVLGDIIVCWGFEMKASLILAVMQGLTIFCTALYSSVSIYLFSGIAVYHMTKKQAITNALMLTMRKLPMTLCLVALQAAMVASVVIAWFAAFPAIALCLYLQARILRKTLELPREEPVHVDEEICYD